MAPVRLTDKDVDYLVRLVATEADSRLIWSHPEEYSQQVHGVVDTVLNRVASGKWGDTVEEVANANRQFSKIAGPKSEKPYGTVDKVPDSKIPPFLPNIVTSWVTARASGTPSSVGGNLHYANPLFSSQSNMGWINGLDGPKLGYGDMTHVHGTTSGFTPIEATVEYGPRTGAAKLQDIQDRNATRLGYGEIAPNPGAGRPAYFNETGAPPVPATRSPTAPQPSTMSPALQAARQRLTAARETRSNAAANGETSAAALAATPRITDTDTEAAARRPPMEWGQFKPSVSAGGAGSLLDASISPGAMNPAKPPVAGLRLPSSPTTITGRPDAPVGSLPVAEPTNGKPTPIKAPVSSASGSAAGRPGGATTVPMDGGKIDASTGAGSSQQPVSAAREQKTAKLPNGKTVTVGQSYIVGNKLMIADTDAKGGAVLRDVTDVRDDFLRRNVDQNAPLLFENSLAGSVARGIAGPMIKQGIVDAGTAARDAAGNLVSDVVGTTGGLLLGARNTLGGMFSASSSPPRTMGNTLSAPGAGLTPAQRTAMTSVPLAAAVKPLSPPAPANTLKPTMTTSTITNPAYTEWVKKYGDGSQVQTAATGGMITKDQLAAIQNVNGAVQAPIKKPAIPPAPPKTITVKKPANTLAAPTQAAPAAPKVQTAQTLSGRTVNVGQTYQSGGYLYTANPNGSFIKVGKVGTPSSNVLSALSTSKPTSAQAYAAANAGPGSVAAMEQQHSGRPAGSYTDSREASGTGSLW